MQPDQTADLRIRWASESRIENCDGLLMVAELRLADPGHDGRLRHLRIQMQGSLERRESLCGVSLKIVREPEIGIYLRNIGG